MRTFAQDVRYGLRTLLKSPGFTIVALLTLTLGIGATAAMFSVVDAVLLRPLPYRDPGQLVMIYEDLTSVGFPYGPAAPANFVAWREQKQVFQDVAALATDRVYALTGGSGDPEKLTGAAVTRNLFSVLGVAPMLGRGFLPEEDEPGGERVAIIGYALWRGRFGGESSVIGRDILLNNEKYTIVGIMPPGFSFPYKDEGVWTPLALGAKGLAQRDNHYLTVVGRLLPGVSLEKVNAQLLVLNKRMAREYPKSNAVIQRFFATPLRDDYTRDVRRGLIVLFASVGFILLIACANIANLLLSRGSGRQREIAIRAAVGAHRNRIVRQLLTESVLLAAVGGALGVLLAAWCFAFLKNLVPENLSGTVHITLDLRVLGFAVLVSVVSSALFGLVPALHISRADLNDVLKEGARGSTGSRRKRLRSLLVIGEVALSMMLLVASGLLLESFANLRGLNPGFRSDHVLTMRLIVPDSKYGNFAPRAQFFQTVLERVRALPGVRSAGFTSALPLTFKGGTSGFTPEGMPLSPGITYDANNRVVTPGYFETMRIALRKGRLFSGADGENAPPVAIVNETMAKTFWPNLDPVGKRFRPSFPKAPWYRIVGVIEDVRQMALDQAPRQEMYFPYRQSKHNWMFPRDLVVRTFGDPLALAATVRRAIWSIDREQPVSDLQTLDQFLDENVAQRRVQATLLGGLAALALALACIGIYGVLSYMVTQRTQEIGVRLALGAAASDIFRTVAGQGMALAGCGILAGIAAALALTRLLANLLFGVAATDPLTFAGAVAVFAAVALLACFIPARRAAKVDPMVALRYE